MAEVGDWLRGFERYWRPRLSGRAQLLQRTSSNTTISLDQFTAAPPAEVWRALNNPDLLARWWVPGDVSAVVGHRFEQMPGWGTVMCVVLEVEVEERFVHSFDD